MARDRFVEGEPVVGGAVHRDEVDAFDREWTVEDVVGWLVAGVRSVPHDVAELRVISGG